MMDERAFNDIYNDSEFNRNATAMLKKIYNHSLTFFKDAVIDFDDFQQEMWCQLFEEKRFNPDRAWCMETMKCDALNYVHNLRNRAEIVTFIDIDETENE